MTLSNPEQARAIDVATAREEISRRGLKQVTAAHFDTNGTLRGKLLSTDSFLSALDNGTGMPSVFMATDYNETVVPDLPLTDPKTGYQNGSIRIDPASMRDFPHGDRRDALLFLMQFDDTHAQYCPRAILTTEVEKCSALGWNVFSAFELEFSVLSENQASTLTGCSDSMRAFEDNANFGSIVQQSCNADFYHELSDLSETMGFPLDALHKELGPGVLEVALKPAIGVRNADNSALFKTMAKALAKRRGLLATFMAKLKTSLQGHGAHVHLSLRHNETDAPLFYDTDGAYGMSDTMRHFIGGLQQHLPGFTLMALPNINSYKRVIPDAWAPVYPNWGHENRTCAFRVVGESPGSKRIEIRLAGADANPYLALAAFLAAGRLGVENRTEPNDPCTRNGWSAADATLDRFPASLAEAVDRFRASDAAHKVYGTPFVTHLCRMKSAQNLEFTRAVTDWEIRSLLVSS